MTVTAPLDYRSILCHPTHFYPLLFLFFLPFYPFFPTPPHRIQPSFHHPSSFYPNTSTRIISILLVGNLGLQANPGLHFKMSTSLVIITWKIIPNSDFFFADNGLRESLLQIMTQQEKSYRIKLLKQRVCIILSLSQLIKQSWK